MTRIIYIAILWIFVPFCLVAQQKQPTTNGQRGLVQFSGIVVESDSLKAVPYTSIIVKNSYRGTVSDYFGYFSFVARMGDTIEFSAIGFQSAYFIIPDTLSNNQYSLIQVLRMDTVNLPLTEIYPWPTKEEFKRAFIGLNLGEDDALRADRNMARTDEKERMNRMAMDATSNYKYSMQEFQSKLYYSGQYPSYRIFNPIAWSQFIKAWQNGAYKKKD